MGKIGLSRKTDLALVNLGRVNISLFYELDICFWMVADELGGDVI